MSLAWLWVYIGNYAPFTAQPSALSGGYRHLVLREAIVSEERGKEPARGLSVSFIQLPGMSSSFQIQKTAAILGLPAASFEEKSEGTESAPIPVCLYDG